ncbi:Hypothetical protein A7982_04594 [Minicystis rosea]|nr:Hypothetical protein A7982_04594 [Minicystis rosea]
MSGTVPEQLEALAVAPPGGSHSPTTLSGKISVSGSERDFTLAVDASGQQSSITVHSPGASPLAKLAGDAMEIETTEGGFAGPSLFVADADGPAYMGVFGDGAAITAAESRLGKGFVRSGDEVASETDGIFVWSYRKAIFKTDDGDVAMSPGEVKMLHFNGATWRAVVIASYQVDTNPDADALPGCSPESLLGFELLRVAEAIADQTPIHRLDKVEPAYAGCTAPGGHE